MAETSLARAAVVERDSDQPAFPVCLIPAQLERVARGLAHGTKTPDSRLAKGTAARKV